MAPQIHPASSRKVTGPFLASTMVWRRTEGAPSPSFTRFGPLADTSMVGPNG